MKWLLRGFSALVLLVVAVVALAPSQAQAAEGFNVLTSPLPIKITTEPGKTVTEELRIKNQSNQPEGIKVGLMKFAAKGVNGAPNLFDLTPKDTYASWVRFTPSQFVAQPNVWNTVKMTITIPSDAGLGYYLAVTFSPSNQPGARKVTNLRGSAASLVLLNVQSPNEKRSLQLADFSTDHKLYEYLPANFRVRLHNNGNIYLPPVGNIFITKGSKTVGTLDFNAAGGSVLPASNREFTIPWKSGFPVFTDHLEHHKPITDKHGKIKQDLKWDFSQVNKFRFGKYTAKLLVVYDDGKQDVPLESTLAFWVLPWKLMLIALVIVIIVGFGVFMAIRSVIGRATGSGGPRAHRRYPRR